MQGQRRVTFSDSDEFVDLTEIFGHCYLTLKEHFEKNVLGHRRVLEEMPRGGDREKEAQQTLLT